MRSEGTGGRTISASTHLEIPRMRVKYRQLEKKSTGPVWPERTPEELNEVLGTRRRASSGARCAVEDCENKAYLNSDLCNKHLTLKRNEGKQCTAPGCAGIPKARGLCSSHYWKMRYRERGGRHEL